MVSTCSTYILVSSSALSGSPRGLSLRMYVFSVYMQHENQRQMRQIQCSVTTPKSDVIQEV